MSTALADPEVDEYLRAAEGTIWYQGIYPHQWEAACFGADARRWILGDEVGLGKTRTVIGWLDLIGARKVIIVCEASICNQFAGEVMDLAPERTLVNLYKRPRAERHALADRVLARDEGVILVNYEIWRRDRDILAKLIGWQADTVIVDEAHNIKSTKTSNYKSIEFLVAMDNTCPACGGAIKGLKYPKEPGERRARLRPCPACGWKNGDPVDTEYVSVRELWQSTRSVQNLALLTGTPILNSPTDLYPLLHLTMPTLFKTQNSFLRYYCTTNVHSGKWEFLPHGVDNLKPLIKKYYLARTREDAGVVLPEQRVHVIPVPLDEDAYPRQYDVVRQISEQARVQFESGQEMTIMHMISLILRKRQANVWPGGIVIRDEQGKVLFDASLDVDESVKIDAVVEGINAVDEHEYTRQVVFSQFKTGLVELEKRLKAEGYEVARLDGDTPAQMRTAIKNNFYAARGEKAKWDILLCNYRTGGTGLNLTSCRVVHILDEEWSPGKRDQAYGRVHRMGQTQETDVYVYRVPKTVDTWVSNLIHRKEIMVNGFSKTMTLDQTDLSPENFLAALNSGEML